MFMTRIRRLCIFTLVSLLSSFGLAAQAGAQDNVPNQRSGAPKSQAKTEETHKAKVKIPDTPSGYTYSVLYSFGTGSADGSYPEAGLTQDSEGNLYGTTADGIYNYAGSVFEVNTTAVLHWAQGSISPAAVAYRMKEQSIPMSSSRISSDRPARSSAGGPISRTRSSSSSHSGRRSTWRARTRVAVS